MTTTYPTQAAPASTSDPTAVMGRRFVGWLLDLLIYVAIVGGAVAMLAEYKEIDEAFDGDEVEFCDALTEDNPDFDGGCFPPPFGDRVYLIDTSDSLVQAGAALGWAVVNFVLISSVAGGSVGKLIAGVRVVDGNGRLAGAGKHILRLVLWIVDGIPGLPVVGGIAAVTSNGHRRVGDMAAGTYVVRSRSVGTPVSPSSAPVPPGAQPWGAAPPPAPSPQPWSQPAPPQPGPPQAAPPPPDPTTVYGQTPPEFDPTATVVGSAHAPWVPPTAEPSPAPPPTPAPEPEPAPQPEPAPAAHPLPEPQWDAARNTYLQWDPNQNAWLQWDATANAWNPIDT